MERISSIQSHLAPQKTSGFESSLGPTSNYYISQRLRLHYVDWGNHDKPLLILIHGARDHCRNWDWTAKALRDKYHVVAPDLRGHGDSEWAKGGEYLIPEFAFDIANLVDAIGKRHVTIIAHSMGGSVAFHYAAMFPERVRKMAIVEGIGGPPMMIQEWLKKDYFIRLKDWAEQMRDLARRNQKKYHSVEDAVERMMEESPFLTREQAHHLTAHGVARNEDGTYSWKFDNYNRIFYPQKYNPDDVGMVFERIECPVLLIQGTQSWNGDPVKDGRIKHFKRATSVMIPNGGHWVQHDNLPKFLSVVTPFLEKEEEEEEEPKKP